MALKLMVKWLWGDYVVEGGNAKCKVCAEELGKSWECLEVYLVRNHSIKKEKWTKAVLNTPIFKVKCARCLKPLDPH